MKKSIEIVGIDPGEEWTGIAGVHIHGRIWNVQMGVLRHTGRSWRNVVDDIAHFANGKHGQVVGIERYAVQPVGHQRFGDARTAQLIGALCYVIRGEIFQIQAGPSAPILAECGFTAYWNLWRLFCPHPADVRWEHALSAWRVILMLLMDRHPNHVRALRLKSPDQDTVRLADVTHWDGRRLDESLPLASDFCAPMMQWLVPE